MTQTKFNTPCNSCGATIKEGDPYYKSRKSFFCESCVNENRHKQWKHIGGGIIESSNIQVYECPYCGYHTGIDATFIEQVVTDPEDKENVTCFSCEKTSLLRYV